MQDRSEEIAYRGGRNNDGEGVGHCPYKIGGPIAGDFQTPPIVRNIETVWNNSDSNIGWVLTSRGGSKFFVENREAEPSYAAGPGLGKDLPGHTNLGANTTYSTHTGPGAPIPLDVSKPLLPQIGHGATTILAEFDSRRAAGEVGGLREGADFMGSPESIGGQIPNGNGGSTSVVDINAITDRQGEPKGWAYLGADGHKYFQSFNANRDVPSYGVGASIGPVSVGGSRTDPAIGAIERFDPNKGQIGGSLFIPMRPGAQTLDNGGLGMRATQVRSLADGSSQSGTILANSGDVVAQFGGRNVVYTYEGSKIPDRENLTVGQSVTIAMNAGNAAVTPAVTNERSQGLERS